MFSEKSSFLSAHRLLSIAGLTLAAVTFQSASAQDADALYAQSQRHKGTDQEKILLKQACELNHIQACKDYAGTQKAGAFFGASLSYEELFWALGRACDLNDGEACLSLGDSQTPIGMFGAPRTPENWAGASAAYKRACDAHGIAGACFKLSNLLAHYSNPAHDAIEARSYRDRACSLDSVNFCGSPAPQPAAPAAPTFRSASVPEPQTPTRAYVEPAFLEKLSSLRQSNTGIMRLTNMGEFSAISSAILADNRVSPEEADFLDEILYRYDRPGASSDPIRFRWVGTETPAQIDGHFVIMYVRPELRQTVGFELIKGIREFQPANLFWDEADRPGSLQRLFESSLKSPGTANKVKSMISAEVAKLASTSTVENGYAPFRGMVLDGMNVINKFEGDDNAALRTLFHNAIEDGIAGAPITIPRFLFNWIDPGLGIAPPASATPPK